MQNISFVLLVIGSFCVGWFVADIVALVKKK